MKAHTPARRFPPPWTIEDNGAPPGFIVGDGNQQALAYLYSRKSLADAPLPVC
jgi:hypothetical protein